MTEYLVKLRYYPGDALNKIKPADLKTFAGKYGVRISYERIESRQMKDGLLMEDTLSKKIEEISQEVITVLAEREKKFSDCIRALYKKYRCPRTVYSLLGSNEAGEKIAKELMNTHGGW